MQSTRIDYLKALDQYRLIFYKTDLTNTILPLMDKYELEFLVANRRSQFNLFKHILDNDLKYWDELDIRTDRSEFKIGGYKENDENAYLKIYELDYFPDWVVGFTMAEGSFGIKQNNSAFYSIRQTGLQNLPLIQAIQYTLLGELRSEIKPDKDESYKIAMTSRADIQRVVNFFSNHTIHPLFGYKAYQYDKFILNLKNSKRYSKLNLPPFND